jgi:hypothetical protein
MQLSMQCLLGQPEGAMLTRLVAAFEQHSTGMTGGWQCASQAGVDWFSIGAGGMKQHHFGTNGGATGRMTEISDHGVSRPQRGTVRVRRVVEVDERGPYLSSG